MRIAHLSDVQIRSLSRHKEFKKHFGNLYASLREKKPDIIVLAGDIVHQKMSVSPELFDMCVDFFNALSQIAPLHMIAGNHDCLLNNPSRMDVITPIVSALQNPNIHYYKHSGIHPIADGVNLVVFSCLDKEEDWPKKQDIMEYGPTINIGLFHGMIQGCQFENDFVPENHCYELDVFLDKVDYLMLGDIHRTQVLDKDCRAAYPGSLIQQNYGESLRKGYFIWDIESKRTHELDFVELPNVCPFYTIVTDSTLHVPVDNLQKGGRIRVVSPQLNTAEEKELRDRVNRLYSPVEIKIVDEVNIVNREVKTERNMVKVENLRNVVVQEELIREFLKPDTLREDVIQAIFKINRTYNAFLENEEDVLRNVRYRIRSLKFDNLFSFGAGNVVNFENLKGINGVFGRNAVGKSSLAVDSLLYCMFNKISKEGAVKNNLYINDQEQKCSAELDIEMGTDTYNIQRSTEIYLAGKRSGNVEERGATNVLFTKKDSTGAVTDYAGEERAETDKEIKKVFGSPEDFMITALAPQFELINFLKNRATDRKKTIGRYFDLDIFEKKFSLANEELKSLKKSVKLYEGKNFQALIEEALAKAGNIVLDVGRKTHELEKAQKEKEDLDKEVWKLEEVKSQKLDAMRSRIRDCDSRIHYADLRISGLTKDLASFAKFACVKNPDCCMKQKEVEVQEKLVAAKENLQKNKQEMADFVEQEKILATEQAHETERLLQERREARRIVVTKIRDLNATIQIMNTNLGAQNALVESLHKEQLDFEKIKKEFEAYHHFAKAMGKDGISYNIIAGNLHHINAEIKKILAGTVSFDVILEDEEKEVNIYLKHGNNKKRLIELCSGMEKTVAAIAIRAALMSVTTLPVPNIIVFDEIFDSLDPDNLDAVTKVLQNLKRLFEVIMIITHSDTVKDICDNVIFIERDANGYARINS